GTRRVALALLSTSQTPPVSRDIAVRILALQGVARAHLHQLGEANSVLTQAEQLCSEREESTCGEVTQGRGVLNWERGDFSSAQSYFEQALTFARLQKDHFLEATALLNLGASFLQEEYFDEAIDWSKSANELSVRMGFGDVEQVALG